LPKVGAFDIDFVAARLRRFAAEYGAGGPPARYVLAGDSLLNERRVRADAGLMMSIMNRHGRLVTIDLPFSAIAILTNTNIRILGLGRKADASARIQLHRQRGSSLARETRGRRIFAGLLGCDPGFGRSRGFGIPTVLASGRNWLVDEQINGGHSASGDVSRFLEAYAPMLYACTVRMRPFRSSDSLPALIEEARRDLPVLKASAFDHSWPVALCHGDLARKNLLRTPDACLWLIDWESTKVMPVAFDLARLCAAVPETTDLALELLRRVSAGRVSVAPELQLVLGLARESKRQSAHFAAWVAGHMRSFGKSRDEAEQIYRLKRARISMLIRAVGTGTAPPQGVTVSGDRTAALERVSRVPV
jgi:hypothetical protein